MTEETRGRGRSDGECAPLRVSVRERVVEG